MHRTPKPFAALGLTALLALGGFTGTVAAQESADLASAVAKVAGDAQALTTAVNIIWVLLAGFLVMFMQAGFACVEAGFTRTKNVGHTMSMNFMVYAIGMLAFWLCGFAFMFGGSHAPTSVSPIVSLGESLAPVLNVEVGLTAGDKFLGLIGWSGFCLSGADAWKGGIFALFLFQMMFMDTAATIPTGALAERWKFLPFCVFALLVGGFIYPVFGNWVWGGGWLAALGKNFQLGHGHVDFAGSSVVHLTGGVMALVGARMIGPRIDKFGADGRPRGIPGHNLPMAVTGTFILAFGWFGFNAGSTLSGADSHIGVIAVNTMLAGAAGAVAGMLYVWRKFGRPDPSFMCNGMLAGLVAITAPCAFVDAWAAVLIGAIAGVLVVWAVAFVENRLRIDDPVGAISVHGVCGAFGTLALGLFANGRYGDGWNGVAGGVRGAFYGDWSQLGAQAIGTVACILAVGTMSLIMFRSLERVFGMRSRPEDELEGLDVPELGVMGYQADAEPPAA